MTCLVWYIFRPKFRKLIRTFSELGEIPNRFALAFLATFVAIFLTASNQIYMLLFFTPVLVVLSKVVHFNHNRVALAFLVCGFAIFFLPVLPYWEILINPAVFLYVVWVAPILIEACMPRGNRNPLVARSFLPAHKPRTSKQMVRGH